MEPEDTRTLQFVGTATTVLRLGPFTLLTDPNFLHRGQLAYLGKGLVSRRLTDPALAPEDLPPLDVVLLSHLHGDHFDRVARRSLDRAVPLWTTPAAARSLGRRGFEVDGLRPWSGRELTRRGWTLRVTAVPGVHAPGPARHLLPDVMGSVLELTPPGGEVHRTYVTGDTLHRPWLAQVVERLGPLDAMVAHLGGTRVLGLLVTMDATQGADLVELLRPGVTVPVHHADYGVFRSPLSDFLATCADRGLAPVVRPVGAGETVSLDP
ncbi:MBL fold metallo-hydrolase [Nocardioides sp. CFH 31398]|uniref:MBL fold metallo-hydrolase n=1 Tax=Nocardioides sp. CFH 31398 TaxID=2919579 RepID=UPI001F06B289|nr:MBL fold metallo-hydrolase [Nocardioides sp. CFH 31398]MCH1868735.1 MBL fold metallo-hydrolase [Nocardioides sp. CFH 31398]